MGNYNFGMGMKSRLDAPSLPVPEDDIAIPVAAADPLAIGGEANLAGVSRHRVASETLVPCLAEVVRAVDKDLIVQRLCGKVFFCARKMCVSTGYVIYIGSYQNSLLGCSVTEGIECIWGSAIYLITTGISKSQARIVLSSEVVTNRLFSSTKVIVFTGPRC